MFLCEMKQSKTKEKQLCTNVFDVVLTNKNKENTKEMQNENLWCWIFGLQYCAKFMSHPSELKYIGSVCVVVIVLKNKSVPNQTLSRCYRMLAQALIVLF